MKKSQKSVLLVVGMPGSGKSTVADAARALGYRVFSFGDIVREEVRRRKLAQNEENVEKIANWFHSGREALFVHRLEKKMHKTKTSKPFYVLDGARSPIQLKELKKKFDVKILAIVAPRRIRWSRQISRGRIDVRNVEDARERDTRETSYGIERVLKQADWKISSNRPFGAFKALCRRFFAELKRC